MNNAIRALLVMVVALVAAAINAATVTTYGSLESLSTTNIFVGRCTAISLTFTNSSTNQAYVRLYDAATPVTNVVRLPYSIPPSPVLTCSVITNVDNSTTTNCFIIGWTSTISYEATSTEKTRILFMDVPPMGTSTVTGIVKIANGISAFASESGQFSFEYEENQ